MLRIKPTLLAVAILASAQASASDDDLRINGFMNITAGASSSDDSTVNGYDHTVSYATDSVMGLQILKQVNDSTSATVQLVARGSEDFDLEASWLYFTYSIDENTDVRMGRLRIPFYQYSDFLEVGYAYNWISPPTLLYGQTPFSSVTGIDVAHKFTMGAADAFVQAYTGRFNDSMMLGGDEYEVALAPISGLVFGVTKDSLSARVSAHSAAVSIDAEAGGTRGLDQYLSAAQSFGVEDAFSTDNVAILYYQASLAYDNGSTSAIIEMTSLDFDSAVLNNATSYMIGGAQRLGDATTVHLTYSALDNSLESGVVGQLQAMTENKESSIILGARYDYDSSTALKVEAEYNDEELVMGAERKSNMLYRVGVSLVF